MCFCAVCTFHMVRSLRSEIAGAMQLDDNFWQASQRMDTDTDCDVLEPSEQFSCSARETLRAFSKDLLSDNCHRTEPKSPKTDLAKQSVDQLQEFCRAAKMYDSGEEATGKQVMKKAMGKIQSKLKKRMKKAKDNLVTLVVSW